MLCIFQERVISLNLMRTVGADVCVEESVYIAGSEKKGHCIVFLLITPLGLLLSSIKCLLHFAVMFLLGLWQGYKNSREHCNIPCLYGCTDTSSLL